MGLPTATLPVWVAVPVGALVLSGVILLLLELFVFASPGRVRCAVGRRLAAIWRHLQRTRGQRNQVQKGDASPSRSHQHARQPRRPRSPLIDFPRRPVTLALLGVMASFLVLYGVTFWRASAKLGFNAAFGAFSPAVIETNTAAPTVGMRLPIFATVNPSGDQPPGGAVAITGPRTIKLTGCYAHVPGRTIRGYARGAQARIPLAGLGSASEAEVRCMLYVVHGIRHLETVRLELTGADGSRTEKQFLNLLPPDVELGQEKAEALAEKEVRTSPASWEPASIYAAPDAFKEQGGEWPLLDPRYLHGALSEPPGLTKTLQHLVDTRVQSSKILTLSAVISSRPVTQERFTAEGSGRNAVRQVYAIGREAGEKDGWCTTTRSTAQRPLRDGDHVEVWAAVIEWGRSKESGNIAVMLNCPTVKVLQSIGKAEAASSAGGAAAPARVDH